MMASTELVDDLLGLGVPREHRARAARTVASAADDPADCRVLLDMLGLSANDGTGAGDLPAGPGAS